jgi:hypothetical protein
MSQTHEPEKGWLLAESERARQRSAEIPAHARPTVVGPGAAAANRARFIARLQRQARHIDGLADGLRAEYRDRDSADLVLAAHYLSAAATHIRRAAEKEQR